MISAQAKPHRLRLSLSHAGETLAREAWKRSAGVLQSCPHEPSAGDVAEVKREFAMLEPSPLSGESLHEFVHAYRCTLHNLNLAQEVARLRGSR